MAVFSVKAVTVSSVMVGAVVSGRALVVNEIVEIDETFDAASLTTTYALYEVNGVKLVRSDASNEAAEIAPVALAIVGLAAFCAIIAEEIGAILPEA